MKTIATLTNFVCSFIFMALASLKIFYYSHTKILVFKSELFQEAYIDGIIIALIAVEVALSFMFLLVKRSITGILAISVLAAYIAYIYGVISGCGCGLPFAQYAENGVTQIGVLIGLMILAAFSIYGNRKTRA